MTDALHVGTGGQNGKLHSTVLDVHQDGIDFHEASFGASFRLFRSNTPRILCLETGGTFASSMETEGRRPSKSLQNILEDHMPDLSAIADLIVPQHGSSLHFGRLIDSSNAQPEDWVRLATLVRQSQVEQKSDGIIITMGTDTMAYAASALAIMLPKLSVPVVLTGAQAGFDARDSDARGNFTGAVIAAGHLRPGVYLAFGGKIINGAHASKISTVDFEAFGAPCLSKQVGRILLEEGTVVAPPALQTHPTASFTLLDRFENGVKVEKVIPGYEPSWLERVLKDSSVRGVVLEAFGLGGLPIEGERSLLPVVEKYASRKPIIIKSQVPSGPTSIGEYEVGRRFLNAGVLSAAGMTLETTTFLLKWLLGQCVQSSELRTLWPAMTHHLTGLSEERFN